ncbi:MAG: hypothetical protein ACJA08_002810 [Cyclobacteriaceae bacterium]
MNSFAYSFLGYQVGVGQDFMALEIIPTTDELIRIDLRNMDND